MITLREENRPAENEAGKKSDFYMEGTVFVIM
jgi:hypothetical protein